MPGARTEAEQLGLYLAYRSLLAMATGPRALLGGMFVLLADPQKALAASIAGGATLLAMPDTAPAKAALRAGCCNFLVSSLDEAVRILKNEIRRKAAISVGLLASLSQVEAASIERGLQPDLLERPEMTLESRGARVVSWQQALRAGESPVTWSAPGASASDLNAAVGRCIPAQDGERRRWLARAPAVLGRQKQSYVPMSAGEVQQLLAALDVALKLAHDAERGALACTVRVGGRYVWPGAGSNSGG